jgi:hypothetical protein
MDTQVSTKFERKGSRVVAHAQIFKSNPQLAIEKILPGLMLIAPCFVTGGRQATGRMLASVLQITGLFREANADDVANILSQLGTTSEFKNNNCFFNMDSFIKNASKRSTGGTK